MIEKGFDWMETLKTESELYFRRYETEKALRLRTPVELMNQIGPSGDRVGIPNTFSPEIFAAYENVLRLLREADISGHWPMSSQVSFPNLESVSY